ncbi:trigger factor [Anaerosinus massiliensis]|uniref:trigger factor n=1 Tax=Massilibacillus massiliensis TaxID=1806837 RepID=UPI000AA94DF1|nr:trigger factor [Massilibacillus massiliensis]
MKVTAERIDNHQVILEIEVPQAEVSKAIDRAYTKLANKINIPGFRKGKAPRKIIEGRVGIQAILDEAFDIVAPKAYSEALTEQKVEPVGNPKIDVVVLAEDKDLVFKATITAKPEITLGEYKGLKVEENVAEVTEEQIEAQVNRMLENAAKMVVAEGAEIQNGDFAVIDFEGFVDGEAFEGGEGKGYPLQIGSGSFIPGFEEQLIGAKAGEERDVNVTFPEEYHAPNLAGKVALFKVKVNDVKRKELPELNDQFVKDTSSFNTVDELKADIKNKLETSAKQKAENDMRGAAIKLASDNATVDIPEIMIENRIGHMIEELSISLQNQGLKLEQYLEYAKLDMAKLRENYREAAAVNVKTDLMLEAVAKAEEIKVEAVDIQAEIELMAKSYGATALQVQKIIQEQGRIGDLVATIQRKKAAKLIVDSIAE